MVKKVPLAACGVTIDVADDGCLTAFVVTVSVVEGTSYGNPSKFGVVWVAGRWLQEWRHTNTYYKHTL